MPSAFVWKFINGGSSTSCVNPVGGVSHTSNSLPPPTSAWPRFQRSAATGKCVADVINVAILLRIKSSAFDALPLPPSATERLVTNGIRYSILIV